VVRLRGERQLPDQVSLAVFAMRASLELRRKLTNFIRVIGLKGLI
jgi:hypothetical protein